MCVMPHPVDDHRDIHFRACRAIWRPGQSVQRPPCPRHGAGTGGWNIPRSRGRKRVPHRTIMGDWTAGVFQSRWPLHRSRMRDPSPSEPGVGGQSGDTELQPVVTPRSAINPVLLEVVVDGIYGPGRKGNRNEAVTVGRCPEVFRENACDGYPMVT